MGFALADSGESEPGDTRRVISPRAICGSRLHVLASILPYALTQLMFTASRYWYRTISRLLVIGFVLYRVREFQKQISLEGATFSGLV